jgi:hypothetical protein
MISFAGLGEGGVGDASGVGDSDGVGAVLGVVTADGVASGEAGVCALGWLQAARIKTTPTRNVAGATPLILRMP